MDGDMASRRWCFSKQSVCLWDMYRGRWSSACIFTRGLPLDKFEVSILFHALLNLTAGFREYYLEGAIDILGVGHLKPCLKEKNMVEMNLTSRKSFGVASN